MGRATPCCSHHLWDDSIARFESLSLMPMQKIICLYEMGIRIQTSALVITDVNLPLCPRGKALLFYRQAVNKVIASRKAAFQITTSNQLWSDCATEAMKPQY